MTLPHTRPLFVVAYTQTDLDHYRCNNVYLPWVNKGDRRSITLLSNVGTSAPCIHRLPSPVALSTRTVRKNGRLSRSGPPSRPRSIYKKGSGEGEAYFASLIQVLRSSVDQDHHYGERTASPERQFECEGWCRGTMLRRATLVHPDVVRWHFSHPSALRIHSGFRRYPSRRPMTVKPPGMRVRSTAIASQ